jgi:hypothetical protein
MFAFAAVSAFSGLTLRASMPAISPRPARVACITMNAEGKGFGGGEATRNPDATPIDPNDPKSKQKVCSSARAPFWYPTRGANFVGSPDSCALTCCLFDCPGVMGNDQGYPPC